jgi:hypothetical protein
VLAEASLLRIELKKLAFTPRGLAKSTKNAPSIRVEARFELNILNECFIKQVFYREICPLTLNKT